MHWLSNMSSANLMALDLQFPKWKILYFASILYALAALREIWNHESRLRAHTSMFKMKYRVRIKGILAKKHEEFGTDAPCMKSF